MAKITINKNAFLYPMPMVLVGAMVNEHPNFMAVAWVTRVNFSPPMIAVAIGKSNHTCNGIDDAEAFSVNVPGIDLMEKTDYCGIVSGKEVDKSTLFKVIMGEQTGVPMIDDCPLCMECKVADVLALPTNTLFVGEIVGAYANAECCSEGKPDIDKIKPFTLTMPDNRYWSVGENIGKAWGIGMNLKQGA